MSDFRLLNNLLLDTGSGVKVQGRRGMSGYASRSNYWLVVGRVNVLVVRFLRGVDLFLLRSYQQSMIGTFKPLLSSRRSDGQFAS
jgi:hypothetical protein